jgi:hypothetical protein
MPAKDRTHDKLKRALQKTGWTIDDEQITLTTNERTLWIDFQISKHSAGLILLVELKELANVPSPVEALANAIGKFMLYRIILDKNDSNVLLYLAVSQESYSGILSEQIGQWTWERLNILLIVFDEEAEEVTQ